MELLLDPSSQSVIYDIRNDSELLADISEASLSNGRYGLAIEHGIVGSSEWWHALKDGRVSVEKFVGSILRVDGGPMGDSAIVRIQGDVQTKSWVAWEGFELDLVGKQVEVFFAKVSPKHPPRPGFVVELILQIRRLT